MMITTTTTTKQCHKQSLSSPTQFSLHTRSSASLIHSSSLPVRSSSLHIRSSSLHIRSPVFTYPFPNFTYPFLSLYIRVPSLHIRFSLYISVPRFYTSTPHLYISVPHFIYPFPISPYPFFISYIRSSPFAVSVHTLQSLIYTSSSPFPILSCLWPVYICPTPIDVFSCSEKVKMFVRIVTNVVFLRLEKKKRGHLAS